MENLEFTIKGNDGQEVKYETLCTVEVEEYAHHYICYTDNSLDENGDLKTFISAYTAETDGINIFPIEDEKEWKFIEEIFNKKINSREEEKE